MSRVIREKIVAATDCPIKVFFGFDHLDEMLRLKRAGEPFLFLDHAYFDRGYDCYNFRAILNGIHMTRLMDVPGDRLKKFKTLTRKWHQGEKVVFIPAAPNPVKYHKDFDWNDRALEALAKCGREVIVKSKKDGKLGDFLKDAWCLVSHSSVAAVEAVLHGVPVVCPDTCPAFPVARHNLGNLSDLVMPDREAWIKTLTYSQFHISELTDGTAWSLINEYQHLHRTESGGDKLAAPF